DGAAHVAAHVRDFGADHGALVERLRGPLVQVVQPRQGLVRVAPQVLQVGEAAVEPTLHRLQDQDDAPRVELHFSTVGKSAAARSLPPQLARSSSAAAWMLSAARGHGGVDLDLGNTTCTTSSASRPALTPA